MEAKQKYEGKIYAIKCLPKKESNCANSSEVIF